MATFMKNSSKKTVTSVTEINVFVQGKIQQYFVEQCEKC